MSIRDREVHVVLPLPVGVQDTEGAVEAELRRLWLIEQVRLRRIGIGKSAELASMSRAAFMKLLGEHGIAVIDYPPDELDSELGAIGRR